MKKIICYIIAVVMILCLFVVPVFATEAESGEIITESAESASVTETEAEAETDTASEEAEN